MPDNTLERAATYFDRVSQYTNPHEMATSVFYFLGDRIAQQFTGEEKAKLVALLASLHKGAMRAGAADANHRHARLEGDALEKRANEIAKQMLGWALDNWGNLTTEQ